MLRTLLGILAVIVLTLGSIPAARASDADVIREAKDRADIDVLIWRYVQALDNIDVEAYPTFFTEDGSSAVSTTTRTRAVRRSGRYSRK